ncbi:MAG: DUF1284 domain-containing protein [Lachnospiraceae bacterium]|nr:DUF1284 domain-containing protein [Lachnospiraceae bacterium]
MLYRIRAHHGMCFSFFKGKGYSGEFTENMWAMKEKLQEDPQVILLKEADDVCVHCPNNQSGKSTCLEKAKRYDRQVLTYCGLEVGVEMRWKDFENLVRENILDAGRREEICGDCEWSGLCRD